MTTEIKADPATLARALARAGRDARFRTKIFDELRRAEAEASDTAAFRQEVRWPVMLAMLQEARTHCLTLEDGTTFEICADSRIEQALLLSVAAHPDHVWEPQTTKLLKMLAAETSQVIIGGAYIGDQAIPVAQILSDRKSPGEVHAFEPMEHAFRHLLTNIGLNNLQNVAAHRLALWGRSNVTLNVSGPLALASAAPANEDAHVEGERVKSISIGDYVRSRSLTSVGLIRLAIEGSEEQAFLGCAEMLSLPGPRAPHLVFELHRFYVDWTQGLENTSVIKLLIAHGYSVYAIRDINGNHPMQGQPIEIIPVNRVYLEGPPHGFNLLATKDSSLIKRFDLLTVENVSPKLIPDKDPALHHPTGGLFR